MTTRGNPGLIGPIWALLGFYPLPDAVAANVVPADWVRRCNLDGEGG